MRLPNSYNYIGAFLTLRCNFKCSYCINWKFHSFQEMSGNEWIFAINRTETSLPFTLQGGEPTLHRDFYKILNGINKKVHLLTNLSFNVEKFIGEVPIDVFDYSRSFAPIRVSYHGETHSITKLIKEIEQLRENGFRIGLYIVENPVNFETIELLKQWNIDWLDFQTKPLLSNIPIMDSLSKVAGCRTKELLISSDGNIYKCHRDLYKGKLSIGNICTIEEMEYCHRVCNRANECHPCDLKLKRDRFGNEGYRSVEIEYGT